MLEQAQHLNDLNVLRHIFMYLFQKCCSKFDLKLANNSVSENNKEENYQRLIETIFGNINEVYECALRLVDLLDEASNQRAKEEDTNPALDPHMPATTNHTNQNFSQTICVGQHIWYNLGEGNEFEVYQKYAKTINDKKQIITSLNLILNNPEAKKYLKLISPGLAEISKYLLHKLLLGSVYHLLYLYETIDYLHQFSIDEEDKSFLKDTLDTLKYIKSSLRDYGFTNSKKRPIESSFRLFQPHQIQILNQSDKNQINANTNNSLMNSTQTLNNSNFSQVTTSSIVSGSNVTRTHALASNIHVLTEMKWKEIEMNVESFKFLGNQNNQSSANSS